MESVMPIEIELFQIGELTEYAKINNAVVLANQVQKAFYFKFSNRKYPLSDDFKLSNGGYDIDEAIPAKMRTRGAARPVIFVTSQPYSDKESENDPEGFYFSQLAGKDSFGVLSTYLWSTLPQARPIQPYFLFYLACVAFDICADLSMHEETRGCPFDYCDNPSDVDKAMQAGGLCAECSHHLNSVIKRGGRGILEQAAAAERLLNRAVNKKQAFVAMPFLHDLDPVFETIRNALSEYGWKVVRADEMYHPRNILDVITYLILSSDLIIADVTGKNPNVFYELGWAFAMDQHVILLTQDQDIPFDVQSERAIKYAFTDMKLLAQLLLKAVGISV